DWCFQVVSEIQPTPVPTPTLMPPPVACADEQGTVSVTSTRLRATPSLRGTVIVELPIGTTVTTLGELSDQAYLDGRLEDGTEGWVAKQTIRLDNQFALLPVFASPDEVSCASVRSTTEINPTTTAELTVTIPPTAENATVIIRSVLNTRDIATEAVEI